MVKLDILLACFNAEFYAKVSVLGVSPHTFRVWIRTFSAWLHTLSAWLDTYSEWLDTFSA